MAHSEQDGRTIRKPLQALIIMGLALLAMIIIIMLTAFSSVTKPKPQSLDLNNYGEVQSLIDDLANQDKGAAPYVGASIAVMKDGELVSLSGYGMDAPTGGSPIDPRQTQFRLGSVSKWFTATALAQLVDEGLVDLNAPANRYLTRFQLPTAYNRAITVSDLLTHRGGLESFDVHTFTTRNYDMPVDGDEIRSFLPRPISPPGQESVYSNFGVSTLGAIVEDVSGMTFGDYVEQNIMQPLGMTNSGLDLQDGVAPPDGLAKPAILRQDGSWETIPYFPKHPYFIPSGGIYSTAEDMTKFMRAHLERGETEFSRQLLQPETYTLMHTAMASNYNAPNIPKFGFVIWVGDYSGHKTLSHSGNVQTFRTFMLLVPDEDLGVFVTEVGDVPYYDRKDQFWKVFNQDGVGSAWLPFRMAYTIASFYLGPREFAPTANTDVKAEALKRFEGTYWNRQRAHSTFVQIFGYEGEAKVRVADDSSLTIRGRKGFKPVGPNIFMTPDGSRTAAFKEVDGKIVSFVDDYPSVWDRTEGLQSPSVRQELHIFASFLLLMTAGLAFLSRNVAFARFPVRALATAAGAFGLSVFLWPLLVLEIQTQRILLEADWVMMMWGVLGNLAWICALGLILTAALSLRRILSGGGERPGISVVYLGVFVCLAVVVIYSTILLGFLGLEIPGRF